MVITEQFNEADMVSITDVLAGGGEITIPACKVNKKHTLLWL